MGRLLTKIYKRLSCTNGCGGCGVIWDAGITTFVGCPKCKKTSFQFTIDREDPHKHRTITWASACKLWEDPSG